MILKFGSKGDAVAMLQKQLASMGYKGIKGKPSRLMVILVKVLNLQ